MLLNPYFYLVTFLSLLLQIVHNYNTIMPLIKTHTPSLYTHTYTQQLQHTKQSQLFLHSYGDAMLVLCLAFRYSSNKYSEKTSYNGKLSYDAVCRCIGLFPDSNKILNYYFNIVKNSCDCVMRGYGIMPRLTGS